MFCIQYIVQTNNNDLLEKDGGTKNSIYNGIQGLVTAH